MFPFRKVQLILQPWKMKGMLAVVSIPQGTINTASLKWKAVRMTVSIPQGTINTLVKPYERPVIVVSIPQGTINTRSWQVGDRYVNMFPFRKVQLIRITI